MINYCNKKRFELKNVGFIGNDINDEEAMKISGVKFCPSDSNECIKEISDYILTSKGGDGVIRELMDILIKIKKGE